MPFMTILSRFGIEQLALLIRSRRVTYDKAVPPFGWFFRLRSPLKRCRAAGPSSPPKIFAPTGRLRATRGGRGRSGVVEDGWCYLQIMSSDVPSFAGTGRRRRSDEGSVAEHLHRIRRTVHRQRRRSVTLKVEAAWRPNYVGTEQKRFFRFDNGKLIFGPAPNSIRAGNETLTRRLTLERR